MFMMGEVGERYVPNSVFKQCCNACYDIDIDIQFIAMAAI